MDDVHDRKNGAGDVRVLRGDVHTRILSEALLLGFIYWKGGVMYSLNFKAWALIFSLIWLASFALAWRVTMTPFLTKFPSPPG